TNNARSLEVGPEPDNGAGPEENQWDGYIAFPTLGGNGPRPAGKLIQTPEGSSELGETIHSHLAWDFMAHYHLDGNDKRKDMGSYVVGVDDKVENFADPGESVGGPYGPYPSNNPANNRYRLVRSFSLPGASSSGSGA